MFSQKPSAPSAGGLTVNTSSANSLFGNKPNAAPAAAGGASTGGMFGGLGGTPSTAAAQPQSGGLFGGAGTAGTQPQQQSGGNLFGGLGTNTAATTAPSQSGSLFGGLGGGTTQQAAPAGGSLFGKTGTTATTQQQQPGGLFGGAQQQPAAAGASPFSLGGTTTSQPQAKPSAFGGLGQTAGTSTTSGGLFGTNTAQQQQQQQPQQQQGPTLSLFGNQNATPKPDQRLGSTVVPGVKIDISNLAPTTKFESCSDELKKEIEAIDTFIMNQVRLCNEVSDLLPSISAQGALIPNDVEFVQGKLDTLQEALENDANGIEHARNLAKQDAAEAKLAFRTLDTLLLPHQYQPGPDRWWPAGQQSQAISKYSLRSTLGARHGTLALPEETESDSSLTTQGGPANLVEYFSHRTDDMNTVVGEYRKNLKEIEDHLHGVELSLQRKISDLASSRGRDGAVAHKPASRARELAATLGDVETAILGVAGRVGATKEEVQELVLGPLGMKGSSISNGWQSRAF